MAGRDQAEDVAAHDQAGAVRHQGPVGIAVGRHQGIVIAGGHDLADEGDILRPMRLRVDRHEGVRPSDGYGLGAEGREQIAQQVAGDGTLLVDRDPQAGEGVGREGIPVPLPIPLDRVPLRGGRGGSGRRIGRRDVPEGRQDGALVGLGDLALGPVEFQAVAVGGNVRPGDHHRGALALHRLKGQRRRGHGAEIQFLQAFLGNGFGHIGAQRRA